MLSKDWTYVVQEGSGSSGTYKVPDENAWYVLARHYGGKVILLSMHATQAEALASLAAFLGQGDSDEARRDA